MSYSSRRRPGVAPAGVVALSAVALSACGGPVEVAVPVKAQDPACAAASEHWPAEVVDSPRTGTEPSDPAVVAWGDPPVIARCGMPALRPTENRCIVVNGIDWVADDLGDGTRMTTFGRDPAIEVIVPEEHGPAPLLMPAFTKAAEQLPTNGYACS